MRNIIKTFFITSLLFLFSITHSTSQSWTQLSPTGSNPVRYGHSAVYDAVNNRMIIFGGGGISLNDVWILSNANGLGGNPSWTQLFPDPDSLYGYPTGRASHTAVYDPTSNRMIIFGGFNNSGYPYPVINFNDTWVLSHANGLGGTPAWTQFITTGNIPSPRESHSAVYDTTNNLMVVFGGRDQGNSYGDVWVFSNANGLDSTIPSWSQLSVFGSTTSILRDGHIAIYDNVKNIMTIFGGEGKNFSGFLNDVWTLSNANGLNGSPTWKQQIITGDMPIPRGYLSAVYDNVNNKIVIFGGDGFPYDICLGDTWILNNANGFGGSLSWTQVTTSGATPGPRDILSGVYDQDNNRMTIFGGVCYSEAWVLDHASGLPTPTFIFPSIPSLKLFPNQSLYPAFDLDDYNPAGTATTYSILSNFLGLTSLNGSTVSQASYSSATVGTNIYLAENPYGQGTATNKIKYSTYKIMKLPKVGLTAGSSWDVNIADYTYDSGGHAIPPSFGNPDSIIISDTTSISATWLGNTVIHISSLPSFTSPVTIDIIASPITTSPYGVDIDKERISVYPNLLSHGTFSTANDTTAYGLEIPLGRVALPTMSWLSSYTDSAEIKANGVWVFDLNTSYNGVKATLQNQYYLSLSSSQWYTLRMRVVSDNPYNNHLLLLNAIKDHPGYDTTSDIAANVYNGIPNVWTWIETPLLVHDNSSSGYPQFIFKASTTLGSFYIDEIQWIKAAPTLVDAQRGNTRLHYSYGDFDISADTLGWGQEVYAGASYAPVNNVVNGQLQLDFSGASNADKRGIKWTANNGVQGPEHAYTQLVTPGREIGLHATFNKISGNFNGIEIILLAAFGVETNAQQILSTIPSNIIASAQVGSITDGTFFAVGKAFNPFYQFQFAVRADQPGVLAVDDVDFDMDNDDPNYGDATLFP